MADEFPDQTFVHITGYKSNSTNFGNLMGAMEDMKYLAGMIAGARAKKDGNPKVGYMATFPIPEELRLGNAFALGAKKTCPDCTMDVRWINTWHDPVIEKEAAASLFDAGAQVVFTGADTPAVADVATAKGKWGITYDWWVPARPTAVSLRLTGTGGRSTPRSPRTCKPRPTNPVGTTSTRTAAAWACSASWKANNPPRARPICRPKTSRWSRIPWPRC